MAAMTADLLRSDTGRSGSFFTEIRGSAVRSIRGMTLPPLSFKPRATLPAMPVRRAA